MYSTEQKLYRQIIGSIMKVPELLINLPAPILLDDFNGDKKAKIAFFAINNLIEKGTKVITIGAIEAYLAAFPKQSFEYAREHVNVFLENALDESDPENFLTFYNTLKKLTLLKELKDKGYNVSPYLYDGSLEGAGSFEEEQAAERMDAASIEEILDYVENNFQRIKSRHMINSTDQVTADDNIDDFIEGLKEAPVLGPEVPGYMMNSVCRGLQVGEMYLCSAGTNVGKTRMSAFEACSIVFPIRYNSEKKTFVHQKDKISQKVFFLTTEMPIEDIRTMILSYVSGVESKDIKHKIWTADEEYRIRMAGEIIKKYGKNFILDRINDPDITNVSAMIKKHILLNQVQYIWFDYIFTSPALISQFSKSGLREDVVLGMMSNMLKEITTTYNVFIKTSTQVNGDALKPDEPRDQRVLRGAKSIADKPDFCYILSSVTDKDLKAVEACVTKFGVPTHVTDVYKTRKGIRKGCRIWSYINVGNGDRKDLFMTDAENHLIQLETYEIVPILPSTPIENIEFYLKNIAVEE